MFMSIYFGQLKSYSEKCDISSFSALKMTHENKYSNISEGAQL